MSMSTPLRMSSVSLDDLPPETPDAGGQKKCARCADWLPLDSFPPSSGNRDGRRAECRHCKRLYNILYRRLAVPDAAGNMVILLPDGSTRTVVEVAVGIVRRGYRLVSLRRPPKSLAPLPDAAAEQIADALGRAGHPLRKLGGAAAETGDQR